MEPSQIEGFPQRALFNVGFVDDVIEQLCGTHKSIMSKKIDPMGGRLIRAARITNHYFGGRNYWEYRPDLGKSTTIYYFVGNSYKELVEAEDFAMVVEDRDYLDYIKKFDPWNPIEVIKLEPPANYHFMPKPPRQDNKATRVGSGNGYMRDVRFPSLKRGKSTWKRFWKLFPEYTGCKTKKEYYQKQLAKIKEEEQWIQSI